MLMVGPSVKVHELGLLRSLELSWLLPFLGLPLWLFGRFQEFHT